MSSARFSKASASTFLQGMASGIALTRGFDTGNGTAQLRVARVADPDQAKALVDRAIDYGRMNMFRSIVERLEEGRPVSGSGFGDNTSYRLTKQVFVDALRTQAQELATASGINPNRGTAQLLHGLEFDGNPKDIEWQDALVERAVEYGRRQACLHAADAANDHFVGWTTPAGNQQGADSVAIAAASRRRPGGPR